MAGEDVENQSQTPSRNSFVEKQNSEWEVTSPTARAEFRICLSAGKNSNLASWPRTYAAEFMESVTTGDAQNKIQSPEFTAPNSEDSPELKVPSIRVLTASREL